jgi:hypothetical protein
MSGIPGISNQKLPFFLTQNSGFRQAQANDDLLHPESFENLQDDSATETQYLGFSVPEQNIHGLCYMWHHHNLRVVSGGLFVFQGIKHATPHAELCDYRSFMSDAALKNDLAAFRLDNGYGVEVLEPMRALRVTYADPARHNCLDLRYDANLPAVMFADGKHFEQSMHAKGELTLRGRHYDVDCHNVRDRSWGKPRPETQLPIPPTSWITGVFNDDFAFNCCALDQARNNPLLSPQLAMPEEKTLSSGWVHRDGQLGRIVSVDKRITRDRGLPVSRAIEIRFDDDRGRHFNLHGRLLASCPFPSVVNKFSMINLIRWQCEDRVGYGDCQESFLSDYLNLPGAL